MAPLFNPDNVGNIPDELKALDRWLLWRYADVNGKQTKVPYQALQPDRKARTNAPSTWARFEIALRAALETASGLGFVLHAPDELVGLDIDKIGSGGAHLTHDETTAILDGFKTTYAEQSPSGLGVHIIGRGRLGRGTNRDAGEAYHTTRFLTVTGNKLDGHPSAIDALDPDKLATFLARIDRTHTHTVAVGTSARRTDWRTVQLDPDDFLLPLGQFYALCEANPAFYAIYERKGRAYKSASEEEMALGRLALNAGWSDQAIYQLWQTWRAHHQLPEKGLSAYQITLAGLHDTGRDASAPPTDDDKRDAKESIGHILGLDIVRFIHAGRDPGQYRIVLANGTVVILGELDDVEKQLTWRRVATDHTTGYAAPMDPKKWRTLLVALMTIREREEAQDGGTAAETEEWIGSYLAEGGVRMTGLSYDVLKGDHPYRAGGHVVFSLAALHKWVRTVYGLPIGRSALASRLLALHYSARAVSAQNEAGETVTRRYWGQG